MIGPKQYLSGDWMLGYGPNVPSEWVSGASTITGRPRITDAYGAPVTSQWQYGTSIFGGPKVTSQTWNSPAPAAPAATTNPFQASPAGAGTSSSTSTQTTDYSKGPFASLQPKLTSGASAGLDAGQQMLKTAADPQNELRAREQQRLQDQVRVGQAARGTTMSPYGAGIENKAMSDFSMDWQDRQLGRQERGIRGNAASMSPAESLYKTGGTTSQTGTSTMSPIELQRIQAEIDRANRPAPTPSYSGGQSGGGRASPTSSYSGGTLPLLSPYFDTQSPAPLSASPPPSSMDSWNATPGFESPGWSDPSGGLQTPRGVAYQQYNDPSSYSMASPAQYMGGITGSNWSSPDVSTVGGTGGASYNDLMSGTTPSSYYNDQNYGGMGVSSSQSDPMWDAINAEIANW